MVPAVVDVELVVVVAVGPVVVVGVVIVPAVVDVEPVVEVPAGAVVVVNELDTTVSGIAGPQVLVA